MMFQRQLITSIENIQRKSGVKCLYPFWSKKAKKIRKGKMQKIRVKNKKQEKESERVFVISLARARVCFSSASRGPCALVKIRARVCTRVFIVFFARVLRCRVNATEKRQIFKGNERRKKMRCNERKKRQFLRLGEKQFHLTSLSFVMKHV